MARLPRLPRRAPAGGSSSSTCCSTASTTRTAMRPQLAGLLGAGEGFHVNLIAYNPTGGRVRAPRRRRACAAFAAELRRRGVATSYRRSHGRDIEAACGQLAVEGARARASAGAARAAPPAAGHRITPRCLRRRDTMRGVGDPAGPARRSRATRCSSSRSRCRSPGPGEVLVRVMAAGVNYNGVWAAAGLPVSIFRYTGYDFHIAGSRRLGHRRARSARA